MSYAHQLKYQREETEKMLRALAAECAAQTENGMFYPIGIRCGSCAHKLDDGCALRLKQKVAA